MSRRSASSSGGLIEGHCLGDDTILEERTEKGSGIQIDPTPYQIGELFLNRDEAQAHALPWHELNEHVDIAIGTEVTPCRGTKHSKPSNAVTAAQY